MIVWRLRRESKRPIKSDFRRAWRCGSPTARRSGGLSVRTRLCGQNGERGYGKVGILGGGVESLRATVPTSGWWNVAWSDWNAGDF